MIWGYRFAQVEEHLASLGFRRVRTVEGIAIFRKDDEFFTIREPNALGSLPENIVLDAFDAAGLRPPPPADGYVD